MLESETISLPVGLVHLECELTVPSVTEGVGPFFPK